MSTKRNLSINFLTQLSGKAVSIVIGLILTVILARALGDSLYGEYTTAITFLQLFGVIVDFGLTLTLAVMLSNKGANQEKVAGNIFGLRMTSAIIMFSLAPLMALPFPWSGNVRLGILIGAGAYICMAGATMLIGVFQKHGSMWRASLAEVISRFVLLALFALCAWLGFGMLPMIGSMIIANLIWLVLMIYFAKNFVRIVPRFDWNVWKDALSQSWPIAVSIIFNLLYLKGDVLFLASFRESTEVGWYGLAYRLIDMVTTIPTMFMGLMLPTLVADWSKNKKVEFSGHLKATFAFFWIIACPIVAGIQIVAEPFVELVVGSDYAPAASVLKLLVWAVPGVFLGALYGHAVIALKKQKTMILAFVAVAIITIIGYLIFIPKYGMYGAAAMTITSETLIAFLGWFLVFKTSKMNTLTFLPLKTIAAAGIMWFTLAQFPNTSIFLLIPAGAIIYSAILFITGAANKKQLLLLYPEKPSAENPAITP